MLRFPLALFLAVLSAAHADMLADLSPADATKVKSGGQVILAEPLEGYPWPRVRVYQAANATPEQVMAVFFDYNNAFRFIPNCLKSKISKNIDPRTAEVDYLIDVPILADEAYTVRNRLSSLGGGAFEVQWRVLKATSILESEGNLLVEPSGEGSLLCYTNLVKPSSRAAFLLKGMALGQMKDTVAAIVAQVEREKANPETLQASLERLNSALGAKN